mgnify:CR=1 FL=1
MHTVFTGIRKVVKVNVGTRVVAVAVTGRAFRAGGNLNEDAAKLGEVENIIAIGEDARPIVWDMIELAKGRLCAINGSEAGMGLALVLSSAPCYRMRNGVGFPRDLRCLGKRTSVDTTPCICFNPLV